MKIIAYTALLYGADYLGYAIRSIIDYVDELWVLYDNSGHGSHGSYTDRPCPDSHATLAKIAQDAAGDKLHWYDGAWSHEGAQRDTIHQLVPDADVIFVLDADEIWSPSIINWALAATIDPINNKPRYDGISRVRVPMVHFWRSFHRAVIHDPAYPERIIFPKSHDAVTITQGTLHGYIAHLGYSQRSEIVEFKQHTHGHRGQWRSDDWFNTVFMANAQVNCHPVGSEYWSPEAVDPLDYMPEFMAEHPYFNLELIP